MCLSKKFFVSLSFILSCSYVSAEDLGASDVKVYGAGADNDKTIWDNMAISSWAHTPEPYHDPVVYGRAEIFLNNIDGYTYYDGYTQYDIGDSSQYEVNSFSTRFGVRGKIPTDFEDINITYKFELGIGVGANTPNKTDDGLVNNAVRSRNQIVGIKTAAGELFAGRHDTALKKTMKSALLKLTTDLFHNYIGADYSYSFMGKNRMNNTLGYKSPTVRGMQYFVTFSPKGSKNNLGDQQNSSGISQTVSYACRECRLYTAIGTDRDVMSRDIDRLLVQYLVGAFSVTGITQNSNATVGDTSKQRAHLFNMSYTKKKLIYKAQFSQSTELANQLIFDNDTLKTHATKSFQTTVGIDFALSDRVNFSSYLSQRSYTYKDGYIGEKEKDRVLGTGIWYKF